MSSFLIAIIIKVNASDPNFSGEYDYATNGEDQSSEHEYDNPLPYSLTGPADLSEDITTRHNVGYDETFMMTKNALYRGGNVPVTASPNSTSSPGDVASDNAYELDDYYVQPSNKEAEVNTLIKKLRVPSIDYNSIK